MNYRTVLPPENLKSFIKYFWVLESKSPDRVARTFGAIVDGCPGAIILQPQNEAFCDERKKKLPGILLYGQTITPVKLSTAGDFRAVGICFQPHALKSVFGFDANELTNTCIDLDLTSTKKTGKLSEQLFEMPTLNRQIETICMHLTDQIKKNWRRSENITTYALSQISATHGNMSMKELQQQLKVSERSLERKFKQTVGISPKLFARICRFQQTLNQMRRNRYDKLSDIAYENDYADQSHFIRVFKEFTGFSPLEFKKQSSEIVENFPQIKS
ncbi:MAG TPA: helix-turn-helix domain-containing protein [Chryseolinea sp.]|nr:helix-turn-helix domain-containing protein [Chryseolinea sp.]